MASQQMLTVIAIVASVLPFAMAADFVVGDVGWRPDVINYTSWVEGKEFRVGDNLIFEYGRGDHNVIEVGAAEFKACNASGGLAADDALVTGNDVVPLDSPGNKWYICGVGDHCKRGQKLLLNVLPPLCPASPPPSASTSSNTIPLFAYRILMAVAAEAMIINWIVCLI